MLYTKLVKRRKKIFKNRQTNIDTLFNKDRKKARETERERKGERKRGETREII